jgi:hypothetical protein
VAHEAPAERQQPAEPTGQAAQQAAQQAAHQTARPSGATAAGSRNPLRDADTAVTPVVDATAPLPVAGREPRPHDRRRPRRGGRHVERRPLEPQEPETWSLEDEIFGLGRD